MKFKRRHGEFEQGRVLSESYTATDALPPILPACRQPLLPACVFVTRDTVRHPRRFLFGKFVREPICSWWQAFVNRGSTVFRIIQCYNWPPASLLRHKLQRTVALCRDSTVCSFKIYEVGEVQNQSTQNYQQVESNWSISDHNGLLKLVTSPTFKGFTSKAYHRKPSTSQLPLPPL
jgi:hypothetical protein